MREWTNGNEIVQYSATCLVINDVSWGWVESSWQYDGWYFVLVLSFGPYPDKETITIRNEDLFRTLEIKVLFVWKRLQLELLLTFSPVVLKEFSPTIFWENPWLLRHQNVIVCDCGGFVKKSTYLVDYCPYNTLSAWWCSQRANVSVMLPCS